jgi:hypothetical protein
MRSRSNRPWTDTVALDVIMKFDGHDLWIIINGKKVAKRGYPDTPEAGTWVALDPRFTGLGRYEWSWTDNAKCN